MIVQHTLFTPTEVSKAKAALRKAFREYPKLPGAATGDLTLDRTRQPAMATWRGSGFHTADYIRQLAEPFIEIGGPTPIWECPEEREGKCWGKEFDLRYLPGRLYVINLLPRSDACSLYGPFYGDSFFRADATRLPFRDASVGAVFCRGLSARHTYWYWTDDKHEEDQAGDDFFWHSTILRLAAFREVVRVLRPGGLLYNRGATWAELSYLRSLGMELRMYEGDTVRIGNRTQFSQLVCIKPRVP